MFCIGKFLPQGMLEVSDWEAANRAVRVRQRNGNKALDEGLSARGERVGKLFLAINSGAECRAAG